MIPRVMEEYVDHTKAIRGYFLTDRKLIKFIKNRPGNQDIDVIKEKVMAVADHDRVDYFIMGGFHDHIERLKIDEPLTKGDLSIAIGIAQNGHSGIDNETIAFASRYCAVHAPMFFPLWNKHSLKVIQSYHHKTLLPSDYLEYGELVREIKSKFSMAPLNFFDISKFFWIYQDYLIDYYREKSFNS